MFVRVEDRSDSAHRTAYQPDALVALRPRGADDVLVQPRDGGAIHLTGESQVHHDGIPFRKLGETAVRPGICLVEGSEKILLFELFPGRAPPRQENEQGLVRLGREFSYVYRREVSGTPGGV